MSATIIKTMNNATINGIKIEPNNENNPATFGPSLDSSPSTKNFNIAAITWEKIATRRPETIVCQICLPTLTSRELPSFLLQFSKFNQVSPTL
jgi:hypothetical protein